MSGRPRRANAAAAVGALDLSSMSLSGGATLGNPVRLQSSPTAAACSSPFPTLSHSCVINAARRRRLPVEPPMNLPVLPRPQPPQRRMPMAIKWRMIMIWPTWKSVSRWSTAAARMLAARAAGLALRKSHRRLLRLARAVGAAVGVEKALGVGEAADEAPKAVAKALGTRMQTTLMVLQSRQNMSGSTPPITSSRRVWSSRASRCRNSRQSLIV